MSVQTVERPAPPTVAMRRSWVVSDALAITKRNLIRYVRLPTLLVFSTIQPVMFVLLFRYVFGGAIRLPVPGLSYVDFLMPGIFVQTTVFGSTQTGIGLAEDLAGGMIERFRSLPMARSAVLAGRTISDSVRNLFVVLLMTGVGMATGFRFHGGLISFLLALVLVVGFGFAFSWISALIGLAAGNVEAAQAGSFVWIFPLVFASSAFVPIQSMPGWLQAFAKYNPLTIVVDAVRALCLGTRTAHQLLGGSTFTHVWQAFAWIIALLLVFVPLSVRMYRKST
ncbi:MAG TPA: ABC transporter permease [Actinomycetota bacterium]|nr:ABC transporter permease [Actinomycetota bacterium]